MNFIISLFLFEHNKTCKSSPSISEPLAPYFQATIIVKLSLSYIYKDMFFKNELGKILMIKTVILFGGDF